MLRSALRKLCVSVPVRRVIRGRAIILASGAPLAFAVGQRDGPPCITVEVKHLRQTWTGEQMAPAVYRSTPPQAFGGGANVLVT